MLISNLLKNHVNDPSIKNFIATYRPFSYAIFWFPSIKIYDISLKNIINKGMEAPPAIAAIVPKTIKALSTPSEYLNKESNETGFILGL